MTRFAFLKGYSQGWGRRWTGREQDRRWEDQLEAVLAAQARPKLGTRVAGTKTLVSLGPDLLGYQVNLWCQC